MRIAVLGASGMLGAMVTGCLKADRRDVILTVRNDAARAVVERRWPGTVVRRLDARHGSDQELVDLLAGVSWVVNGIGVIKPYIRDDHAADVERAIEVNALFPHRLARAAERTDARVLQIATDCVYSGQRGRYVEADEHDARDVYGKSKSLGEVRSPAVNHLRCSIIGPELKGHVSLLDWFARQPRSGTVCGFVNHRWNGVTTLHFGRLCVAAIRSGLALPHSVHVVPSDVVTKAELLGHLATSYRRDDLSIEPVDAALAVDRTLETTLPDVNRALWDAAGYKTPPTIATMVQELSEAETEWPERTGPAGE